MISFKGTFYDEAYFERGKASGKGLLENYHWMPIRSFKEALSFIDTLDLDESSYVLDIGGAKGFLVRAFRELGIKADCCDISKYALSFAPEGCWNCEDSLSWEDNRGKYTHAVLKDVLEHLNPDQLQEMLKNIAKVASKFMCVVPMGDKGVYRIPEYQNRLRE